MRRNGFTLIELLVVIGIIAILASIMIAALGGSNESALAAKCLVNMKNLASACQACGGATGHYPLAGSVEKIGIDESRGVSNAKMRYSELPGWLSWNSQGAYRSGPSSHVASLDWFQSAYNQDFISSEYCYTNGTLWKYVSGVRDIYVCPVHAKDKRFRNHPPKWSYVMNSYFGWDSSRGTKPKNQYYGGIEYGKLSRGDRRLLFAEIPFSGIDVEANTSEASGLHCDCTLQYKSEDGGEAIGFNHKSGKREWYAHVVFADGHTEKLRRVRTGMGQSELRQLTEWLCEAKDVSFNGTRYKELK